MDENFPPPVAQLLTLGEPKTRAWRTYAGVGIITDHVPDLFHILRNPEYELMPSDNPAVWAPLHAWRALAQLRVLDLVPHLLKRIDEFDDDRWDDSLVADFSDAVVLIGEPALDPLIEALQKSRRGDSRTWTLASAIAAIGRAIPDARPRAVAALNKRMAAWRENTPEDNGGLIAALIELRDQEAMPLIREAMEAGAVDEMITGPVEFVEFDLGLRDRPPAGNRYMFGGPFGGHGVLSQGQSNARERARKRRKIAKASKKRNRKK